MMEGEKVPNIKYLLWLYYYSDGKKREKNVHMKSTEKRGE